MWVAGQLSYYNQYVDHLPQDDKIKLIGEIKRAFGKIKLLLDEDTYESIINSYPSDYVAQC